MEALHIVRGVKPFPFICTYGCSAPWESEQGGKANVGNEENSVNNGLTGKGGAENGT